MAFTFKLSPLSSLTDGERSNQRTVSNNEMQALLAKVSFDGTQSNGDVIPLFKVYGNDIFINGGYANDALTGMTDVDLGLYRIDGTAVDADFFVNGDSLASAQTTRYGDNALSATNVSNIVDNTSLLGDLSADLDVNEEYVVALTVNVAGSASGDFVVKYDVLRSN